MPKFTPGFRLLMGEQLWGHGQGPPGLSWTRKNGQTQPCHALQDLWAGNGTARPFVLLLQGSYGVPVPLNDMGVSCQE